MIFVALLFSECFALQAEAFSFYDIFSIFFKPSAIQSSGVFSLPTAKPQTEKDLSGSCIKLLNATALGKKYLSSWSNGELQGYCKFLKEFPSGLGNAVINVMRSEWYSDSMVRQAVELDSGGNFKNFFKRGHPLTVIKDRFSGKSKTVDAFFDVWVRENYIKARALSTELRKWEDLKKAVLSEADYFKYSPLGGRYENTIVIELRKGTKLDTKALQQAIFNAYKEGYSKSMINVTRVGIYNAKNDTVLLYDKEDYEWNARTVKS